MRYKPLNDCILIDPEPDPDYAQQTGSSLIVPDLYKYGPTDPPKWGIIIAFGPTCSLQELKLGDRVLYGKFSWAKLPISETKHYALVRECDIIAIDTKEAPTRA